MSDIKTFLEPSILPNNAPKIIRKRESVLHMKILSILDQMVPKPSRPAPCHIDMSHEDASHYAQLLDDAISAIDECTRIKQRYGLHTRSEERWRQTSKQYQDIVRKIQMTNQNTKTLPSRKDWQNSEWLERHIAGLTMLVKSVGCIKSLSMADLGIEC